jgi:GT2 family glycosyltransferase
MVLGLLESVLKCDEVGQVLLTLNIPETLEIDSDERLQILRNAQPKGFGANHNAAFELCNQAFFCVLNPDIAFAGSPFAPLLYELERGPAALVAPLVLSPQGLVEDSVRYFPTLRGLLAKLLWRADKRYAVQQGDVPLYPEWVAGMFMLFRREAFTRLGGFDEGFFLYYEDVDICVRAWRLGLPVLVCPSAAVVHDARRDSRRNLRHMRWHLASMARYFCKYWGRLPKVAQLQPFQRIE